MIDDVMIKSNQVSHIPHRRGHTNRLMIVYLLLYSLYHRVCVLDGCKHDEELMCEYMNRCIDTLCNNNNQIMFKTNPRE